VTDILVMYIPPNTTKPASILSLYDQSGADHRGWRTGEAQLNLTRRDAARVRIACRR